MTRIGVFDSGLGGVKVLNDLAKNINAEFFYLGDNLRVPYGVREKSEIKKFAGQIVSFLEKFDIDFYIIACNTISVTSKDYLINHFKKKFIPITDIAIKASKDLDGDYFILATKATVESHFYKKSLEKFGKVYESPGHGLVDLIEDGLLDSDKLDLALAKCLRPANDKKIKNIILACTHYPIIKEKISNKLSYQAEIIDPAAYLSKYLMTKDSEKRVYIYMTKRSKETIKLVESIMEVDYVLEFVGDLS